MDFKIQTPIETLAKGLPIEFVVYLNYCRSLKFDDRPDYKYLKRMFKDLYLNNNFDTELIFDWTLLNYGSK